MPKLMAGADNWTTTHSIKCGLTLTRAHKKMIDNEAVMTETPVILTTGSTLVKNSTIVIKEENQMV